jgi:hypothetical protein
MSFLNDVVLDEGLSVLTTQVNRMDLCTSLPATYVEATTTYSAATKTNHSVGAPTARTPDGRKVVVAAVTDGVVNTNTTVGFWALVDTTTDTLLAADALPEPVVLSDSFPWTSNAFDIGIPGPV